MSPETAVEGANSTSLDGNPASVQTPRARTRSVEPVPRLSLRPEEAAASLGVSRRTLDGLIAAGLVRVVRCGRRVVIPVKELERYLDREAAVALRGEEW